MSPALSVLDEVDGCFDQVILGFDEHARGARTPLVGHASYFFSSSRHPPVSWLVQGCLWCEEAVCRRLESAFTRKGVITHG